MKGKNNRCPYCGSRLSIITETSNEKVCNCQECNITLTFKTNKINSSGNSNDNQLTHTNINSILNELKKSNIPQIITASYENIIYLLENDEIYGALIKLKDTFELIIKLPLIVIISHISNNIYKSGDSDSDFVKDFGALHNLLQELIYDIISYTLTLGNWVTISGEINKYEANILFKDIPNQNHPITTLHRINQLNHKAFTSAKYGDPIAAWRNKTIGHGALNCNKKEIKKDILIKLELLNNLLKASMNAYSEINLLINDNSITVKSTYDSTSLEVEPFIAIVEKNDTKNNNLDNLSIFDSYNSKKQIGHIINHLNGQKHLSRNLTKTLSFIEDNLKKSPILPLIKAEKMGSLYDDTIYSDELEIINSLQSHTFYKGTYFSNWFINCIENFSGGVFLCCAERGMGKTAFTQVLNQNENVKIENNDVLKNYLVTNSSLLIRTYHFNAYYNSNVFTFINRLKDIFTSELIVDEDKTTSLNYITYISHNIEEHYVALYNSLNNKSVTPNETKVLFFNFLKSLHLIWKYKKHKDKLVLVLDGIDEIKTGDNNINIVDWIPNADEIKTFDLYNIYIIVTSRCREEVSSNYQLCKLLTSNRFSDSIEIKRELKTSYYTSPYSLEFISNIQDTLVFKKNEKMSKYSKEEAIKLAEMLDWRFNYLGAYKKIFRYCSIDELNDFISDPFKVYFTHLEKLSKTYSQDVQFLLCILLITDEPLTINEISYLITGDSMPNFKIYGMLMDIANFLTIERDYRRGPLFNLSHLIWVDNLNKNDSITKYKSNVIKSLAQRLHDLSTPDFTTKDYSTSTYDGESWLISNLNLFESKIIESLIPKLNINLGENFYQLNRTIRLYSSILNNLNITNPLNLSTTQISYYLNAHSQLIKSFSKINLTKTTELFCNMAITFCESLLSYNNYDDFFVLRNLSKFYYIKAQLLRNNLEPAKVIDYFERCISINEKLINDLTNNNKSYDLKALASSNKALGNVLANRNRQKALIYYEKAIAIEEHLASDYKNGNESFDLSSLAISYRYLANTLIRTDAEKALVYYEKAIDIGEQLAKDYKNGGKFFDLNTLAISYRYLASSLTRKDSEKALSCYEKAINIEEQLASDYENGGRFFDLTSLAVSYHYFASFLKKRDINKSFEYFNRAIGIEEKLAEAYRNGGRFFDLNSLAVSYHGCANTFRKAKNQQEELEYLNKAIRIEEELAEAYKNGGRFFDIGSLARSYHKFANALRKRKIYEDSLKYFNKAIAIEEKLANDYENGGKFFDMNILAGLYYDKSKLLKKIDPNKALELSAKTLLIKEKLATNSQNGNNHFNLYKFKTAEKFYSLACMSINQEPYKALEYLDKAIAIEEKLASDYENGGKFFNLNELATLYKRKAIWLKRIGSNESLIYFDKAKSINAKVNSNAQK